MTPDVAVGAWSSTFGAVRIKKTDRGLEGEWTYLKNGQEARGTFSGPLHGNLLEFAWVEDSLRGKGYLSFDPDGKTFRGQWINDAGDRTGDWNGWRTDPAVEAKKQADELAAKKQADDLAAKQKADELAARKQADELAAKKQADENAKKQTQPDRHQQAVAHFKQAEAFFKAKLYPDAIGEYDAGNLLELWPPSFFNIGEAYRLAGKGAKAIEAYKRYLELLPKGPRADECRTNIALITKELRIRP